MKYLGLVIIALLLNGSNAFSADSLITDSEGIRIVYHTNSKTYSIWNKLQDTHMKKLKYVQRIANYYQVLSAKNKIFYINDKGHQVYEVEDYFFVCGTVPHYELEILQQDGFHIVMTDETFYDGGNRIPAEEVHRVSTDEADSLMFMNGMQKMNYTSNYNVGGQSSIQPNTIVMMKDGKYSFLSEPSMQYDEFIFTYYGHIVTVNDNLQGFATIIEPKFKKVSNFVYSLAAVEYPNGKKGYIDLKGNEYPF
ncbi:hypothetical protein [Crocinitomix catalasitica]|uniref:hypothetical protein n=1 Tax=Crocinitomix catalasitica TaxID=184607 RepID=UPI0004833E1E|nr:hypothetical protein [Crocinitomix catalasitica]